MLRRMRTAVHAGMLAALALGLGIAPLRAQAYPSKTIKLVVPFGPGGPTDVSARLVAQVVQAGLGENVVIENRPGAGGATGTKAVANAEPDGYTLLIGTSATLAVVPALVKSPGYDPIKSFAPVAKILDSTLVLIVPAKFPANSVKELVAYGRANPGKLSYASAGAGNQTQLLAELFKAKAGVEAPAGTPAPVIERLNAAINQGLRSPEIGQTLAGVGAQTAPGSPQDFGNFIVSETAKW